MEAAEGSSTGWRTAGVALAQRSTTAARWSRGRAAAPADRRDPELGDEAMEVIGQLVGCQVVVHLAVDHRGESRIGDAGDGDEAGRREMPEGLAHLDGAGGTVEADDVDLHGAEHGERPRDLGAGQHAAGELDRDLDLDRHDPVEGDHGPAGAVDGGLGREEVEDGLDQEEVDAALEEPGGLLLVGVAQVGVGDLAQRGEFGARSHAARHPTRALRRGELGRHGFGDLCAGAADFTGAVGQPVLSQHDRGGAERAGLDDVAPNLEERAVHLGDEIGAGADQDLVAALEVGAAEVLGRQAQHLQVGAHRPVEDEHPLPERLEIGGCGGVETSEQFGGA